MSTCSHDMLTSPPSCQHVVIFNSPFEPTTASTEEPTSTTPDIPTNNPTEAPSQPTARPTDGPTNPTIEPTMSPISCDWIYVQINDFDILTSDDIKYNESLQIMMANITHFAIAEHSVVLGISREQFLVNFYNVSYPLYMVHTLCAFEQSKLTILSSLLSNDVEDKDISASMESRLKILYGVEATGAMEVIIDKDPIELSRSLI